MRTRESCATRSLDENSWHNAYR